ncbi:hypothetical protein B0H19DRAFT_506821 [Mycena capillaripes]|nr:hypothetical protein B0H19DRAFT_506821 [Mycena capillaripes]
MSSEPDTRWSFAPSSSPLSSPTACNDSSPASSPGPEYDDSASVQDDYFGGGPSHASPPQHPFAASAKSSWVPPQYEKGAKKNRQTSPSSPSRSRSKKPRILGPEASLETLVSFPARVPASQSEEEKEVAIWDKASDEMVDLGNGTVMLEGFNLSRIPDKFVQDLYHFYVPPEKLESINATRLPPAPVTREFSRSITAPAILGSGVPFSRVPDRALGSARHNIQLYLASNKISRVPVELLCLDKLTVLSLRNNKLKTLPPEIRHLKNLHTLNVANNQLEYLPAEMLDMTLQVLNVFPNRFKKHPQAERSLSSKRPFDRATSQRRIGISPTSRNSQRVPSLVELSLRLLFSTDSGLADTTNYVERRIEKYYELPLCEADVGLGSSCSGKKEFRQVVPPHLRRVLDAIHPGSVDVDAPPDDDPPSLGLCPAPHHVHGASVFVTPAEERYTWETVVAGVAVGGGVPLKWRGCLWGCLDFLGAGMETEPETPNAEVTEMEVEGEQDAVTRVQLRSDGFGMDDFEDDG